MTFESFLGTAQAPIPPPVRDVLLLEPDPQLAMALSMAFLKVGRRTRVAASMADLRRAMRERLPGVLVAETWVSDGDLRNLLSELRRLDLTAGLPVLALLPEGLGRLRRDLLAQGADAVFRHPLDPEDVARAVSAELRRTPQGATAPGVDPLTGLLNRGGLVRVWEERASLSEEGERPALVLFEVEGIDALRRAVGWDGTDRAAIQIASVLDGALGDSGTVGRWASLRFVAFMPNADRGSDPCSDDLVARVRGAVHDLSSRRFRALDGTAYTIRVQAAVVPDPPRALDRALSMAEGALSFEVSRVSTQPVRGPAWVVSADPRVHAVVGDRFARMGIECSALNAIHEDALPDALPSLMLLDGTPEGGVSVDTVRFIRAAHDAKRIESEGSRMALLWMAPLGAGAAGVQALALGADDVLLTPFSPSEFETRVLRWLP